MGQIYSLLSLEYIGQRYTILIQEPREIFLTLHGQQLVINILDVIPYMAIHQDFWHISAHSTTMNKL